MNRFMILDYNTRPSKYAYVYIVFGQTAETLKKHRRKKFISFDLSALNLGKESVVQKFRARSILISPSRQMPTQQT